MARGKKKRGSGVYRTDISRLSVYPRFQKPQESLGRRGFSRGEIIKVRVTGQDDDGNPTGVISGYIIVIRGADAEPGDEFKVRIVDVRGKIVYAEPIRP